MEIGTIYDVIERLNSIGEVSDKEFDSLMFNKIENVEYGE